MLLHLGGNISILKEDIIAIFDFEAINSDISKEFLDIAKTENKIIEINSLEKNKSIVILKDKIYISPISSLTLQKRTEDLFINNN